MDNIEMQYEVRKIIYRDDESGFTILDIKIIKHPEGVNIPTAETKLSGNFRAVHEKDEFLSSGFWYFNKRKGFIFKASTSSLMMPETQKGLVRFIRSFSGNIGQTVAQRIVDNFKDDTIDVIVNHPERLSEIKGMTEAKKESLFNSVKSYKEYEDVILFLSPLGLNHLEILKIYEKFGYATIFNVSKNPYSLYLETSISFKKIDIIAKNMGLPANSLHRVKALVLCFLENQASSNGDLFVYEDFLYEKLNTFALSLSNKYEAEINKEEINKAINKLTEEDLISISYRGLNSRNLIYLKRYKVTEDNIIRKLSSFLENASNYDFYNEEINAFIKNYESKNKMSLAEKQKKAIFTSIKSQISILSGGPGTGKTETTKAIIECFKEIKPKGTVRLLAPTGRASKRMSEVTGLEASTIHSGIGLREGESGEITPIEEDFLIIDESSMVDATLFNCLLSAISSYTKILIIGDYEQLPSVGPGLILRDLMESEVIPTVILDEVFRQKKESLIISNAINISKEIKEIKTSKDKDGDFYFIEKQNPTEIREMIKASIKRLFDLGYKKEDIQILSPVKKGDLGVVELNRVLQEVFNKKESYKDEIEYGVQKFLRVGDKVIQHKNDPDLKVFNGEIGIINSFTTGKTGELLTVIDFDGILRYYDNEALQNITLAYSITTHKSQGSEFPVVIMPFHSSLRFLNKNLLYTGITRAKEKVICIGDKKAYLEAIDKTNLSRNSTIKARLSILHKERLEKLL